MMKYTNILKTSYSSWSSNNPLWRVKCSTSYRLNTSNIFSMNQFKSLSFVFCTTPAASLFASWYLPSGWVWVGSSMAAQHQTETPFRCDSRRWHTYSVVYRNAFGSCWKEQMWWLCDARFTMVGKSYNLLRSFFISEFCSEIKSSRHKGDVICRKVSCVRTTF